MNPIPKQSEWLKADAIALPVGVDRDANVIRGFVMAQEGPFKSKGRGEFDLKALKQIVKLANSRPNGLKSRFAHPSLSGDGIGTFLGRVKNARLANVQINRNGELLELNAVRGDLHLDPTSFDTPSGNLGEYVMSLAESDPDAMSSSLVVKPEENVRLDNHGKPRMDESGEQLPPLWWPLEVHAADIVDTGDAVDGFLSVEGLNDSLVRQGCELLKGFLPGQPREVVEARLQSWLNEALNWRYGNEPIESLGVPVEDVERALRHKIRSLAEK